MQQFTLPADPEEVARLVVEVIENHRLADQRASEALTERDQLITAVLDNRKDVSVSRLSYLSRLERKYFYTIAKKCRQKG